MKKTAESIRRLFPEVNLMKSARLGREVIGVWEDAIRSGGWTVKDLDRIPFTLLIPKTRVNLIRHTRAVTQTAIAIAGSLRENYDTEIKVDMDILIAGSLLHDVGKLLEYRKMGRGYAKSKAGELLRHPFSGQALAYKHDLPAEILHMIAYHSKEGDLGKRSVEAIIIHHADFVNFEPLKA